jgi:hypothetical protein
MKSILFILLAASAAWGQFVQPGHWTWNGTTLSPAVAGVPTGGGPTQAENVYCLPGEVPNFGSTVDGPATLPQACVDTAIADTPSSGTTLTATDAVSLTIALSTVACGQSIVIPATATISGANFTLAAKACDAAHWITIRTDQVTNPNFPAAGNVRATPCQINLSSVANYPNYACPSPGTRMPTLIANSVNQPFLISAAGANHYRLVGLNITKAAGVFNTNSLVNLSNGADHIIFDRVLMHGVPLSCSRSGGPYTCNTADDLKVGINLNNATAIAVINSWMWDFYCTVNCTDSQAVVGGYGGSNEGPYKIYNSMLSAAGEDFFQGGGGQYPNPTAIPADLEFRQNHLFKPVSFVLLTAGNGNHPIFKNNSELKNFNRALIEGNEFENSWSSSWQSDQVGYQLLITPKNQSSPHFGTATSDGVGGLTAVTGTFSNQLLSVNCSTPSHCPVKYNGQGYKAQTWIDSAHITVAPVPAASGTAASFTAFTPGLCPTCAVHNVTVRYNDFRNSTNGIQFATAGSDGGDISAGMDSVSIHDDLFQGLNSNLSNSAGASNQSACFFASNGQTTANVNTFTFEHNTCAIAHAGPFSFSGLDVTMDSSDTTTDGSTGVYFSNRIVRNNIGPAGGQVLYKAGTIYAGGLQAGLKQQSCTPPVTGSTCTWVYTRNVLGLGQWTTQTNNTPFPCTNADVGATCTQPPAPAGCNAAHATCFPNGSAFTSLFVSYGSPAGQPGYLGDYHLAANSPYAGAGTDGKDIGANIDQILALTSGVRSNTTYAAASVTTTSLPNATVGNSYSQQLLATSASDFQIWHLTAGSFPPGIGMSLGGTLSGTPTVSGTSNFTVQMMDGAQQYATRALSLTVN